MDEKLLTRQDLANRYGVAQCTIDRWVKAGRLPAPLAMQRAVRFYPDEVRQHEQRNRQRVA